MTDPAGNNKATTMPQLHPIDLIGKTITAFYFIGQCVKESDITLTPGRIFMHQTKRQGYIIEFDQIPSSEARRILT